MKISQFFIGMSLIGLSACATSGTAKSSKTTNPAFTSLPGGGAYHAMSGLECPVTLNGLAFEKDVVFAPDGSDVGCSYKADNQAITVYLTEDRGQNAKQAMAGAVLSAAMVGAQGGLKYNKDASSACTLAGLLGVAAEKPDSAFGYEAAILKSDTQISLVGVHPTDNKIMKLRMTQTYPEGATMDDEVQLCVDAAKIMVGRSGARKTVSLTCAPTYKQVYRPAMKLGGSGSVMNVRSGEVCKLKQDG